MGKIFSKKWRDDGLENWDDEAVLKLRRDIMDCIEGLEKGNNIDIIVCGALGCGKSSFVNNCMASLSGEVRHIAEAGEGDFHITKWFQIFQSYTYQNGKQKNLPLQFCDTKGIASGTNGASLAALKACILGKVRNKEEMNQRPDREWEERLPLRNKVSYILLVADAANVPDDPKEACSQAIVYGRLHDLRTFAMTEEIPVAAILTKCDQLEEKVRDDISNLQYSATVMTKVRSFSGLFGIQENRVFPVKNYTSELNASSKMRIQTLLALRECLRDIRSQQLAKAKTNSDS